MKNPVSTNVGQENKPVPSKRSLYHTAPCAACMFRVDATERPRNKLVGDLTRTLFKLPTGSHRTAIVVIICNFQLEVGYGKYFFSQSS